MTVIHPRVQSKKMKKVQIILASKSPRRKAILKQVGIDFSAVESNFEEKKNVKNPTASNIRKLVIDNAKGKALDIASKINGGVVLGVDTVVLCEGKIIGKPKDSEDAKIILNFLNNKMHEVFSGIALVGKSDGKVRLLTDCEVTKVYFCKLTEDEIEQYISTGEPLDKAGAYGIQERGAVLIKKIDGDFYNVVGLPLVKFLELDKRMNR